MKVVIILPTYNERENIELLLEALEQVVTPIKHHSFFFLVADDSSPDGTADVVRSYQKKHKNIYLVLGKKEGLGRALLRGMTYAVVRLNADIIGQMDADLSHDPKKLGQFIQKIDEGADFVVGSRYIPGGSIPDNWGLHRKIFSILGNAIVRFGLGYPSIHDWTGGYRVYRKKFYELSKAALAAYSGYVFQIAFLDRSVQHGANVAEVPIQFTDRKFGRSKIAPSEYIRNVLVYVGRARYRRLRHGSFGKFLVVGSVGFIINTVILELMVLAGFVPAIGSAAGAELAIISNFFLNNTWTFRHKTIQSGKFNKLVQFNLSSVGAIVIQAGTVLIGTSVFGLSIYRWFYVLGVGIGLFYNYLMYSRVIWKDLSKTA